jgi:hypothetical protein
VAACRRPCALSADALRLEPHALRAIRRLAMAIAAPQSGVSGASLAVALRLELHALRASRQLCAKGRSGSWIGGECSSEPETSPRKAESTAAIVLLLPQQFYRLISMAQVGNYYAPTDD